MTDALRIHYCLDKPRDDRRGRARCGHWVHSNQYTDEPERVTCKACRKLLALPPQSKTPAMTKLSSILPFILLSACGPLPADDIDGSTSSGGSTSAESTGSTGTSTGDTGTSTGDGSGSDSQTGDDTSTSGDKAPGSSDSGDTSSTSTGDSTSDDSTSSTGEDMTGSTMGEVACFAESCADMPCAAGMDCVDHPDTHELVCAPLCVGAGLCNVEGLTCGEAVGELECRPAGAGAPRCFPV